MSRTCLDPGMVTLVELPVHVSICPSPKASIEETGHEYQCTIWTCVALWFREILASNRFQSRLELWQIIHASGSDTKARFEITKMLRSHLVSPCAICFTASVPTSRKLTELFRCKRSMPPSAGGKAKLLLEHLHFVRLGP